MAVEYVNNTQGDLVNNNKKRIKKRVKLAILIIVIIIILAIVADLIMVYLTTPIINVKLKKIDSFESVNPNFYKNKFILSLDNPTDKEIQVDRLTFNVYSEFYFIYHGEKTNFLLSPGENDYTFSFTINVYNLSADIRDKILNSMVTIKIKGILTIPLKLIDTIKFGEFTNDYEYLEDIYAS